jgi:hypothetical protein
VAADKTDDPGVLGNLPRSRPGRRSDKRGGTTVKATAKKSSTTVKSTARAKPAARKPPKPAPRPVAEEPRSTDPLTGAVRLAGKVAEAGLKTAGGLLRRLPGR